MTTMNQSNASNKSRYVENIDIIMRSPCPMVNNQTNECKGQPTYWLVQMGFILCLVIIFFGILGNTVTIAAYKRNRKLQSSFNHLITNLCSVNLVFAALVLPSILPLLFTADDLYPPHLCSAIGYCYSSMISSSVINLVFIAINRFVGIVHSSKYRHFFSKDIIKWWVVAIWISAPIFYLPLLLNGSYQWQENSLNCVLQTKFDNIYWTVYRAALDVLFLFIPVIILSILYRAILLKVKKSRKSVEHYPRPVSRSPSILEMGTGARSPRRGFPALRRQNSSIRRKTEQKLPSSPAITPACDRRSGLMAYLQVPSTKPTQMQERKQNHWGEVTTLAVDMAQSSPDLTNYNGKRSGIVRQSKFDQEMLAPASPIRKSLGDLFDFNTEPKPLLTSERPRKRIQKEMKDLQIMSTIESEPTTTKNLSIDHNDNEHEREKSTSIEATSATNILKTSNQANVIESQLQDQTFLKVQQKEGNSAQSDHTESVADIPQTKSKRVESKKKRSPKNRNFKTKSEPQRTSLDVDQQVRRHSTSTCTDSRVLDTNNNDNDESEVRIRKVRRSLKGWRWKREKYNTSARYQRKMAIAGANNLAKRRFRSEESHIFHKSWRRSAEKNTDSTNIKIVVEQATSEDSEGGSIEDSFKNNVKKQHNKLKRDKENDNKMDEKNCLGSNCNCCKSFITKLLHNNRDTNPPPHIEIESTLNSLKKTSDSSYAIPTVEISSPKICIESSDLKANQVTLNDSAQTSSILAFQNNIPLSALPNNLDYMMESSEMTTSEDRRSSITSHVYRYTVGADDCLSRQGSYSCISYADDYTRSRNGSRRVSREYETPTPERKKTHKQSRGGGSSRGWTRKKSIFSSMNSSVLSEGSRKRRRKDAEKHLAYNGLIICIAFALCVLPTYAISCVNTFTNISVETNVIFAISMLSWIPAVVNPLLYGFLNPQYRIEFRRMTRSYVRWWRTRFGCCHSEDARSETDITSSWQSRLWRYASAWESKSSRPPTDLG